MNASDQINELATALAKAQGQMAPAKKDSDNPFFKSKYADLAAVVDAIRGPFAENGLSYVQLPKPIEGNAIAIETVLMHTSGQWISSVVDVPVAKADAQGYGSAITYARRYGLQAMAGLAAEDDDGNAAAKAKPRASEAEMMPTPRLPDRVQIRYPDKDGHLTLTEDEAMREAAELSESIKRAAAKFIGRTTFTYGKGTYNTAGLTRAQFIASLDLAKAVAIRYKDPEKAHKLLVDEFGVQSRSELTEETGARYCARLKEILESE